MALPPEKITELKQIIHTQLCQVFDENHVCFLFVFVIVGDNVPSHQFACEDMTGHAALNS